MPNIKEDSKLFRALADENNLALLTELFEGEKLVEEIENKQANIEELFTLQLIRRRVEGDKCYIRVNKVGKFRAIAILESYLKTRSDMAVCGNDEL
ncbi:MAG: hypothetical protein K6G51_02640 [Sphaerochaetaceae bacterium]|nr:hypothetical protein [Sphaerochaetaceae bacterium]